MAGQGAILGGRRAVLGDIGLGRAPGVATVVTFAATMGLAGSFSRGNRAGILTVGATLGFSGALVVTMRSRPAEGIGAISRLTQATGSFSERTGVRAVFYKRLP